MALSKKTCLIKKNNTLVSVLFFFISLILISCSPSTRSLFFDIPPDAFEPKVTDQDQEPRQSESKAPDASSFFYAFDESGERPPIEDVANWEEALEMLPKDYKKDADWSAAIKQGVVRPRTGLDPKTQLASAFKYDFIIESEKPKNNAYFPHSAHTEWLGCQNCHISLYPLKRNPAKMRDMKKGESCGFCHGKVAFSLKQCKRCHLSK